MNLRFTLLILLASLFINQLQAAFVPQKDAELIAKHFYWERVNNSQSIDLSNIITESVITVTRNQKAVIYHFNFKNQGFVSVSADDAAYPILAYDFQNHISTENVAINYQDWMNRRADEIAFIRKKNISPSNKTNNEWIRLKNVSLLQVFSGKSIDPLIHAKWNQDAPYNALSPADAFGPGGHAYAGCVAVAMAQIIHYYRFPVHGSGSHSYYSNYGQLTANFAAATYDYNSMTNSMPMGGNYEIAELLYHCAVAVDMGFSASGSGAYPAMTATSLKQYFGFQSTLALKYRNDYTFAQWVTKIVNNIDNKIPLFYAGYSPSGGSGHAFNLDGYQGSDFFHFNWGWGGAFNGYFYLSSLTPGSSNFSNGQQAIFDIYPAANYPVYCTTTPTLTNTEGSLYDGSGTAEYLTNQDCQWLIQPTGNIDHLIISFDVLDMGLNDTVYLYDGTSVNDPILAKYTGGTIPPSISSSGNSVFVRMITDASLNGDGFGLSYRSKNTVFCSGTTQMTLDSASFSDGSQFSDYNNSSLCRWYIKPNNGQVIKLVFTAFDTETAKDVIKIYDPSKSPSVLLASYSGSSIPKPVVSTSGEMMVIFQTDPVNTKSGWEAYYISGASVGMDEIDIDNSITIFPNPVSDQLNIQFHIPLNNVVISVYSIEGRLIEKQFVNTEKQIILSTSQLEEGYYIVKIQSKEGVSTKSFIVKH